MGSKTYPLIALEHRSAESHRLQPVWQETVQVVKFEQVAHLVWSHYPTVPPLII